MSYKKMTTIIAFIWLTVSCGYEHSIVTNLNEADDYYKGLTCTHFKLNNPSSVPDFQTLTSTTQFKTDTIYFQSKTENETLIGFINDSKTEFGLSCYGYIEIRTSGNHTFYLTSDDGANLYIDGRKIVTHDGLHSLTTKNSTVYLSQGIYKIRVDYFQNLGYKGLMLTYSEPGGIQTVIPKERLYVNY